MLHGLVIAGLFDAIVRYLIPLSIVGGAVVTWFGLVSGTRWRTVRWAAGVLALPWLAVFFLSAAINRSPVDIVRYSDHFDRPEPVISAIAIVAFGVTVGARWLSVKLTAPRSE